MTAIAMVNEFGSGSEMGWGAVVATPPHLPIMRSLPTRRPLLPGRHGIVKQSVFESGPDAVAVPLLFLLAALPSRRLARFCDVCSELCNCASA